MKITRVILASDSNEIYSQFWNPISKIYKENFDIHPTLVFFGTYNQSRELGLSEAHGDIHYQKPVLDHHIGWQTTWSLFWWMKKFPEDTFIIMGIDQVPLSKHLIEVVPAQYDEDSYLMLADNGYDPQHWSKPSGVSPSSYHIVKGSVAQKIYGFEDTFDAEIHKVASSGIPAYYGEEKRWGLDESYSSHKLRQYRDSGGKIHSASMFKDICQNRIECCRTKETPYDEGRLKNGWYWDAHLCRPVSDHKQYIEKLLSLIPK